MDIPTEAANLLSEAQAALDAVGKTLSPPFTTVKSVAPLAQLGPDYYELRFIYGPALTVHWFKGRETFQQACFGLLARYLGGDGSALLADHHSS